MNAESIETDGGGVDAFVELFECERLRVIRFESGLDDGVLVERPESASKCAVSSDDACAAVFRRLNRFVKLARLLMRGMRSADVDIDGC